MGVSAQSVEGALCVCKWMVHAFSEKNCVFSYHILFKFNICNKKRTVDAQLGVSTTKRLNLDARDTI